jgi:hypothetical protein
LVRSRTTTSNWDCTSASFARLIDPLFLQGQSINEKLRSNTRAVGLAQIRPQRAHFREEIVHGGRTTLNLS